MITRVDALKWLCYSSQADAAWVLNELHVRRPGIFAGVQGLQIQSTEEPLGENITYSPKPESHSTLGKMPAGKSIIQFSSPTYFCTIEESVMVLDVIRIGDSTGRSEAAYETVDGSARDGEVYAHHIGRVAFRPGESTQRIEIRILDNGRWNTTTEFKLFLKDPVNSVLGAYLFETRVKVIDTTTFPSNAIREIDEELLKPHDVLLEFFKMTWKNPVVNAGTKWCMGVDVLHNLWYFLNLFLTVYLLDHIIRTEAELWFIKDRKQSLILYGTTSIAAHAILHWGDYSKTKAHMGRTRTFIQEALIRKYLNYTAFVRQGVNGSDITLGVERDAHNVAHGYMSCLMLIAEFEKLACMVLFKLLSPVLFGSKLDLAAIVPLMVFPPLLGVFLVFRESTIAEALASTGKAQEVFLDQVAQTVLNCSLVIDYERRSFAADMFGSKLKVYSRAQTAGNQVLLNTNYFAHWVTTITICAYVIVGGMQVIDGSLSIGMFVMDLKIFDTAGHAFSEIFKILVDLQRFYPSIMKLYHLLNLPTDIAERMQMKRAQRQLASEQRKAILKSNPGIVAVDVMPIVLDLRNNFRFEGVPITAAHLNFTGRHEIIQGQMVAIIGGSEVGKRTLLHLISGRVLPGILNGDGAHGVFVPAHLRIITVCENCVFFSGTLYENLTFGMQEGGVGTSRERVMDICRKLGVAESVLDTYLDLEEDWDDVVSENQRKLLNIARALINNAEVICLHKPMAKLDPGAPEMVVKVLHEHINEKGLHLDSDSAMRRPRTVFLSSANLSAVLKAHSIFSVSREHGISKLTHEEAKQMDSKGNLR